MFGLGVHKKLWVEGKNPLTNRGGVAMLPRMTEESHDEPPSQTDASSDEPPSPRGRARLKPLEIRCHLASLGRFEPQLGSEPCIGKPPLPSAFTSARRPCGIGEFYRGPGEDPAQVQHAVHDVSMALRGLQHLKGVIGRVEL